MFDKNDTLIETTSFTTPRVMADFIKAVNRLIQVSYGYPSSHRYLMKLRNDTDNLDGHIKYIHIKDSTTTEGVVIYRMLAMGTYPCLLPKR